MDLSTRQGRREQGQRLQRAVERAGLSIEDLANRIGCSRALIYQYVSGSTLAQPDRLQQIATECGVSLTYFYIDEVEQSAPASQKSMQDESASAPPPDVSSRLNVTSRVTDSLRVLQELALAQESPPDYRSLASTCERIVLLAEQQGDFAMQARALFNLGKALNAIGDSPRAIDALSRAVALSAEIGDNEREISARQSLGKALLMLGKTDEARDQFLRVASGTSFDGKWKGLISLGSIHEQKGEYQEAMSRFDEAATILEEGEANRLATPREISIGLLFVNTNRRNVYIAGGDFDEARALADRGVTDAEALGNADQNLEARFDLGWCEFHTGRWTQSYHSLTAMLQLARFVGDQGRETRARAGLGIFLAASGDYDTAISYGKDALAMALPRGDRLGELYAQLALADAYTGLAQRSIEARYHTNQALAITSSVDYARAEIESRLRLARLNAHINDNIQLRAAAERALELAQKLGARHLEGLARCWLAESLCRLLVEQSLSQTTQVTEQDPTEADLLEVASREVGIGLDLAIATGLVEARWRAYDVMANLALYQNDSARAEARLREAIATLDALRLALIEAGLPDTLLENEDCSSIYERLARLLLQQNRFEETTAFLEQTGWPPIADKFSMELKQSDQS